MCTSFKKHLTLKTLNKCKFVYWKYKLLLDNFLPRNANKVSKVYFPCSPSSAHFLYVVPCEVFVAAKK